jgi:DNA-binding beta-propeller fold protein YncE
VPGSSKALIRQAISAIGLATLLCLAIASAAPAADRIYWVNEGTEAVGPSIGHANLAGGGGGEVSIPGAPFLFGLGIDPAAGRFYSLGGEPSSVFSASLDGTGGALLDTTGAPPGAPNGLAVDPAGGRVYWTTEESGVLFANLRGGGGGALNIAGVTPKEGGAVAVHPAAGKIYWDNKEEIAFAGLSGSGAGRLDTGAQVGPLVSGLAVDGSAGRIYWINQDENEPPAPPSFMFASLDGGQSGELDTGQAPVANPVGLAIDPQAGRIYWVNAGNGTIGFASLSGSDGGQLDTTGATLSSSGTPVLLKTPVAASPPLVKGKPRAGKSLTCEAGRWAPDLPESFLYRAPQTVTYQWLRNGRPVASATGQTVKARLAGRYACQAIGTNAAGSASSTSSTVSVKAALRLGKVRLNRPRGTATLTVAALGGGKVRLSGAGIKRQTAPARAKARLRIRPSGRAKKRLEATGRVRVKAVVSFRPASGKRLKRSKKIVLKLSR